MKMDSLQIQRFLDCMFGWKSIGVDVDGTEITASNNPEMRAFIVARLGMDTPNHGHDALRSHQRSAPVVALLREVADSLERLTGASNT
jgi:hypothetical protein